ncbi:MAG: SAM-dependent methyltransferase, partial [Pseudomonadota bacterium]
FAVPGASAALAAVTASGLAADRFFFEGFLPTKSAARRRRIGMLADVPGLIVIYESPGRLAATLADLAAVLGNRSATVMRELTKRHEAHVPGTLAALAARYDGEDVRGECVILVSPAAVARQVSDGELEADLRKALETQRLGDAAREIAQLHGVARKRVYDLGLALRAARADG